MLYMIIVCALSVLLPLWYAITFNDSRLVVPMDFRNYVFEIRDLPMLVSVCLTCIYLVAWFVMLFIHAGKSRGRQKKQASLVK